MTANTSTRYLSELHRAAVEYALDGWKVFVCRQGGKEPATANGFKDRTSDIETINHWFEGNPNLNIATVPEDAGLCVLDVEAEGLSQLDNFCVGHAPLAQTFANKTPRGGKHLWFRGSLPGTVRPFEGYELDTRGRGSYVLLPPSRTVDGEYETLDDSDIADLPSWLSDKLDARKLDRQGAPDGLELDLPANIQRGELWLATFAPPVPGQRNNRTWKAACKLKDLGLSPQTILDMLLKWAPLSADFTEDEVYGRVVSAFENGQNAPGCDAVTPSAEAFAKLAANVATGGGAGPVLFADVLKRDVQPVAELIPGLIEKGVATMLAGPGGVHKSRTAMHWGLAISAGERVYGRPTEQARFIFLSYEDHADEVGRRAQAMTKRLKCDWGENAEFWDMTRKPEYLATVSDSEGVQTTAFYDRFRRHLQGTEGHKFVVLDSTYNVLAFLGQTKISEPAVKAAIELLNRLCRETDSTIVFLWHPSQAGQERGDASGWSVAWHNAPRARLSLSRIEKGKDAFELRVEKRNNAIIGQPLTLHWDNGVLLPISAVGVDERAARFLEACVTAALNAAASGAPIQKQGHLHDWQIREIEYSCGTRPTQKEVKAELARAIRLQRLRYCDNRTTGRGMPAGYYPFEVDKGPFLSGEIMHPKNPDN